MSAIGGMLGLNGGVSGTGFQAPQSTQILQGTNQQQVDQAYGQNQQALVEQDALMRALAAQGGMGKQEGTYNELGGVMGSLQNIAAGQGPNPAQAMLNQQTGANIANQAALMAGQRGVGQNTGLLARQAAMQGGALQQQAVGQGAVMQANQSLGALGQLGSVIGQRAGLANQMVANQMAGVNANTSAQQAQQGQLLNALAATNNAQVGMQSNINSANAGLAGTGMQGQQGLVGGLLGAAGTALGKPAAHGGIIGYAGGGAVGPQSEFGQFLNNVNAPAMMSPEMTAYPTGPNAGAQTLQKGVSGLGKLGSPGTSQGYGTLQSSGQLGMGPTMPGSSSGIGAFTSGVPGAAGPGFASGGAVDVMLSPGEKVVPPTKVAEAADGNIEAKTVPGEAKVAGDSLENDTYKTKLPPGSIVIPRSHAQDEKSAAAFVRKTLARRGKK